MVYGSREVDDVCRESTVPFSHTNDAMTYLVEQEYEVFTVLPSRKRVHWLHGRIAAKQAITAVYSARNQICARVSLRDVAILTCGLGRPSAYKVDSETGTLTNIDDVVAFSISHCDGYAYACAALNDYCTHVGVDVERVRHFNEATARAFLTEKEFLYCMHYEGAAFDTAVTLHWCLKEAYLKACGVGLRTHPRMISVAEISQENAILIDGSNGGRVEKDVHWTIKDGLYILVRVLL
jgi:phosphopantetheinyl transferase (holo-ACP synthase)